MTTTWRDIKNYIYTLLYYLCIVGQRSLFRGVHKNHQLSEDKNISAPSEKGDSHEYHPSRNNNKEVAIYGFAICGMMTVSPPP